MHLIFKVKYSGTKSYNSSFTHGGIKEAEEAGETTVKDLVPGTQYTFELYGSSECGKSPSQSVSEKTKMKGKH